MSMQKFIEIQQEKLEKANLSNENLEIKQIIEDHIQALNLLVRNYDDSKYSEEEADELALVCAVLTHNTIPNGSIWSVHDTQFKIAKAFLKEYPLGAINWGEELEYEETVYAFGLKYCTENNIR